MQGLTRRAFLKGGAAFGAGTLGLSSYAFGIEPGLRLGVASYRTAPPGWPAGLALRIAVIADIHACEPWMSAARVGNIVALANALKPDLTVLLGDYVCTHPYVTGYVAPEAWAERLADLRTRLGVYAILGNHDWWSAAIPSRPPDRGDSVRRALEAARVPLLENRAVRIEGAAKPFWLLGLADQMAHRIGRRWLRGADDLDGTLAQASDDAPAIMLAHEPFIFRRAPDRIALTLAGHTHGGQINFPFIGAPFAPTGRGGLRYVYGEYSEGARRMIVSGGLGTSIAPVRFLRPPEVVEVVLGGAEAFASRVTEPDDRGPRRAAGADA